MHNARRIPALSRWTLALALAGAATLAQADGLQRLEAFVKNAKTGRADFTQAVTPPAREGETPRVRNSSGSFEFQRPGRFRFDYRKPFEQTIVADGKTLSIYDADLNQVTQRAQAQALGSTPAALIASAADVQALRADYELQAQPARDGLEWVRATPKAGDGQLRSVQIGFAGDALAALEIEDAFGQRSVLRFNGMQLNAAPRADAFRFQAPAGADVIRQ